MRDFPDMEIQISGQIIATSHDPQKVAEGLRKGNPLNYFKEI